MSNSNNVETMRRLNRLENAIGSQVLSDQSLETEKGVSLLQELIDSAGSDDFDAEAARKRIISGLKL